MSNFKWGSWWTTEHSICILCKMNEKRKNTLIIIMNWEKNRGRTKYEIRAAFMHKNQIRWNYTTILKKKNPKGGARRCRLHQVAPHSSSKIMKAMKPMKPYKKIFWRKKTLNVTLAADCMKLRGIYDRKSKRSLIETCPKRTTKHTLVKWWLRRTNCQKIYQNVRESGAAFVVSFSTGSSAEVFRA